MLNRVSGFKIWTNMPRVVFSTHPAEIGSKEFERIRDKEALNKDGLKRVSLFQTMFFNEGPLPKKSIIMRLEEKSEDTKKTNVFFTTIDRVSRPEKWGLKETKKEKEAKQDKQDAQDQIKLSILITLRDSKKGIKSGDLKDKISIKHNTKPRRVSDILKSLKDVEHISGGGSGKNSAPFKITTKGSDWIDK